MATRTFAISRQASVMYPSNYASANDKHHPVGKWGSVYLRTAMAFNADWSGMTGITRAELKLKTAGQTHVGFGTTPRIFVQRITGAWSASGGGESNWTATGQPDPFPASTATGRADSVITRSENALVSIDITDIVKAWAPVAAGGSNAANYGIALLSYNEGSTAYTTEFLSSLGGYASSIVVTYTEAPPGKPPTAPSLTAPSGRVTGASTPTFTAKANSTSPHTLVSYDIQVATDSGFTSKVWDAANRTTGVSGENISTAYGGTALARGRTYYWRIRTKNNAGFTGPWATAKTFSVNALPTIIATSPSGTIAPATAGVVDPGNPTFVFTGADADAGDAVTAYDLQVSTSSSFASIFAESLASATGLDTATGKVSRALSASYVRGTTYYWRARVRDKTSEWSAYSATRSFKFRALPTSTPTTNGLASVSNLSDRSVWTDGGRHALATVAWSGTDADGGGLTRYRLALYAAASGGTALWSSGDVASTSKSGVLNYALVRGTTYYWTVQVGNKYEWGAESARSQVKVQWGQAILTHQIGASSSGITVKAGANPVGTQVAFAYRGAATAGGGTPTAWSTSPSAATGNEYIQVLVRLATTTSGTPGKVPDITLTYLSAETKPDGVITSALTKMSRDSSVLFGAQPTLRVVSKAAGSTAFVYFRYPNATYVPVESGETYTFSCWVRTDGPITGPPLKLLVNAVDDNTTIALGNEHPNGFIATGENVPLWKRIWMTFVVKDGVSLVRPYIHQGSGNYEDTYWIAAPRMEFGSVAGQPVPNLTSDLASWDGIGGQVDASAGGVFRLRGADGALRSTVELGTSGLKFGGDTELTSPAAGVLASGGSPVVVSTTKRSFVVALGLWIVDNLVVSASQRVVPYGGRASTTTFDNRPNFPGKSGRILGIAVRLSTTPTGTGLSIYASRNGANVGTPITPAIGSSVYQQSWFTPVEIPAGQSIGVNYDTTADYPDTGQDFSAWVICEVDV
jgi:hypothetical protein